MAGVKPPYNSSLDLFTYYARDNSTTIPSRELDDHPSKCRSRPTLLYFSVFMGAGVSNAVKPFLVVLLTKVKKILIIIL